MPFEACCEKGYTDPIACTGANANAISFCRRSCGFSRRVSGRGRGSAGRQGRRRTQRFYREPFRIFYERLSGGDSAPRRNLDGRFWRLQNYDMAPERLALSVSGVPSEGWTATLIGRRLQPVAAAMPATNSSVSLSLRLDVPERLTPIGTQTLTVAATRKLDKIYSCRSR